MNKKKDYYKICSRLSVAFIFLFLSSCSSEEEVKVKMVEEPVNVELFRVEPSTISKSYTASAILKGVNEAVVTAGVDGEIKELYLNEGDYVKAGQKMALIDKADYQLELSRAEAVASSKKQAFLRVKDLFSQGVSSRSEYDSAEADYKVAQTALSSARLNLKRTSVTSPISGQVTTRYAILGNRAMRGEKFFHVVNTKKLKMTVSLSEKEMVHLKSDDYLAVFVDAWKDERFVGKVRSVRVSADPNTASFPVEITLKSDSRLKPGMVARVTLRGEEFKDLLLVPSEAIFERIGSYYLFVYKDGFAELRDIEQGMKFGEKTEVKSGIEPGEEIIPIYGPNLKDGSPVTPVNSMGTSDMESHLAGEASQ